VNYKGAIISKLKVVMNEGYKQKFHKNEELRQFRRMSEVPETIALTADELDRLWSCNELTQMESKARDLFIIGVYSVARWEDYSRISADNISNGMLNYEQLKTGRTVILPVSPRLQEALDRNGGIAPRLSQQKFNGAIKRCCKKIGMTDKLHISKSKGAERVSEKKERCELVSSHTARRTGATMLYLAGVPAKRIMLCTGHSTEANFMRYVRITKEENARMLADNEFFK
jgi:integrase